MKRLLTFILTTLILVASTSLSAMAQQEIPPVPVNPDIKIGRLENGLTYYILKNSEPEKRASFYIIQNVGAILENDDQNGLAHFLEHMAFNGTKNFPEKGIINTLEKHGVAFGRNINAYTAHDETIYNMSDVPVDDPGLIDTCLLVLHDWSDFLLLTEKEIDAERGVITEEWRTRRNSSWRLYNQYFPVLLKDSPYAKRDVIGDVNLINSFKYNTLRDFYHTWYRTDLQAIAVVGDIDPLAVEKKIIDIFSDIAAVENPKPKPAIIVPEHKETLYVLATDKEATEFSVSLYIKHPAIVPADKNMLYLRDQFVTTLMNSMASNRISEILQKGTPPFITASIGYSGLVKDYNTFYVSASFSKGVGKKAFSAVLTEAERIKRHGFTDGELIRAKANLLTRYETYYKQRDKIDNDTYASNIAEHFLNNEPIASTEFEFEFLQAILPSISVDELNDKFRSLYTQDNRVVVSIGTDEPDAANLSEAEALSVIGEVEKSEIKPYEEAAVGESLLSDILPGGKVVDTKKLPSFGATEWTLSNGARVLYRFADHEKDQVTITGFSMGGSSIYGVDKMASATMLPSIVGMYGAGEWDNVTLQKMMSGKKASVNFSVTDVAESLSGSSTPKDFEIMMQLLYLKFARPRFDAEAHNAIMGRYSAFLSAMGNDPQKIMQDSVSMITTSYNPRTQLLNSEMLSRVSLEQVKEIYTDRFRNAGEFVFIIVGNIDEEVVKSMTEKYIGSLPAAPRKESYVDHKIAPPKGKTVKSIPLKMTTPKSTVYVNYTGTMDYTPENILKARVISAILDLIYTEKIREDEGGTYGVSASVSLAKYPNSRSAAQIVFDCDPEKAEALKAIVYSEIEKLKKEGPSKENLNKATLNLLKTREESKLHNSYYSSMLYALTYNGIDMNNPANYEEVLKNLTQKDIKKAAGVIFGKKADVIDIIFKPAE